MEENNNESPNLPQELKNLKLLVASTQWPYYGGSATNAYQLIKYLRKLGYNVAGLYFNDQVIGDVDQIGGVFVGSGCKQALIEYLGGWPDIILGKNYLAPLIAKKLFPFAKLVYLLSGSAHLATLADKGMPAKNYLNCPIKNKLNRNTLKKEIETLDQSIYIIPNSLFVEKIFRFIYRNWNKKIQPWVNLTAISYELSILPETKKRKETRQQRENNIKIQQKKEKNTQPTADQPDTQPTPDRPDTYPTPDKPDTQPTAEQLDTYPTPEQQDIQPTPEQSDTHPTPEQQDTQLTPDQPENENDGIEDEYKEYDIAFVATNFKRKLKNAEFVKRLFKHPSLKDKSKVVIGINSTLFNNENIENLRILKNKRPDRPLSHYMILNMISKSKVLIIPSLWDSNPNVVYEALANETHVLLSDCVGIHELFDEKFVATVNNMDEWIAKLTYLIENHNKIEFPQIFDQNELKNQVHSLIKKVAQSKNY